MVAYWMVHIDVHNEEEYAKYVKLAGSALAKYNGKFLARGGRSLTKEGVGRARNVIIRFENFETAERFYDSPEYQKALAFAMADGVSTREFTIIEGV